ncbi:MAG: alanine racemase [Lachnospiraceae bacterium]
MEKYNRTYAVVNTGIIKDNLIKMKSLVSEDTLVLAVIKADAYGHGAVMVANALKTEADFFGVATVEEAVELRNAGINNRILILGYTSHSEYKILIEQNITPVIYRYEDAELLNRIAGECGKRAKIHIAVDTGMGRIGFRNTDESINEAIAVFDLPDIEVEGAFSHFACADESDKKFTEKQVEIFEEFIKKVSLKYSIKIVHIANSAGIIDFDTYRYNMVRAGISMYGYLPSSEVDINRININPALEWHAHVTNIKTLHKGDTVSYGATCVLDKETVVATVSVGYADGYPRLLSNKGKVIINNQYAKVLGRVCMDQIMVDITGIQDVTIENDVILLGKSSDCSISADDIAVECNTISYEVLCDIGKRVPRIYE